jgi:TRAP-type C4-dicarboxylate transport system substrate-binding protein
MRALAVALFFASFAVHAANKKPEYVIRWQVNHYPLRYFTETAAKMNEMLKESTGGRVVVKTMTNPKDGWLTDVKASLAKIWLRNDDYEMAQIYTFNLTEFEPKLFAFDLPYLFTGHDHFTKVVESPLGETMTASLRGYQLEPLAFTYSGGIAAIASRKPLRSPSDFKDLNYLAWEHQVNLSLHALLGTHVINSSKFRAPNVYPVMGALQAHAAEAGDCGTNELWEMAAEKGVYYNLLQHRMISTVLLMNKPFFDKMPKELQVAVKKAAVEAARWERDQIAQSELATIQKLKDAGKPIVTLTAEETAKMKDAMTPIYKDYSALIGAKNLAAIQEMGRTQLAEMGR